MKCARNPILLNFLLLPRFFASFFRFRWNDREFCGSPSSSSLMKVERRRREETAKGNSRKIRDIFETFSERRTRDRID